MSDCYLSIVIPAYNEERRLPGTLDTVCAFLATKAYAWEILVADDGSSDNTAAIVCLAAQNDARVRLVSLPHRGKGWAVKNGMLESGGKWRFLCDADLSMPIEFLDNLLPDDGPSTDIIIGSREAPGARRIGEPRRRWLMGRAFNAMTRILAAPGIADTQCGFKVFRAAAAETLFSLQTLDGFAFDAEILFLARRRRYTVAEIGIDWHYRSESKVRPLRDGWRTLRDLVIIRYRSLTGRYTR